MCIDATTVFLCNTEFLVDFDVQGAPVISVAGVDISDIIKPSIAEKLIDEAAQILRELNND